jgi:hypothetical protein
MTFYARIKDGAKFIGKFNALNCVLYVVANETVMSVCLNG